MKNSTRNLSTNQPHPTWVCGLNVKAAEYEEKKGRIKWMELSFKLTR